MTYLQFHFVFILPPLLLLAIPALRATRELGPRARWAPWVVPILAFVYTTPWDNYLVWRGVWGYGDARVLGTLGYVPIEEYLFFLLQPLLTGAFLLMELRRAEAPRRWRSRMSDGGGAGWPGVVGVGGFVALSAAGVWMLGRESTTYMGLILAWACPLLAIMWGFTWRSVVALAAPVSLGIGIPTLYLWIADRYAIQSEIWTISDRFTVGFDPFGLPIEEATFFLVTNLLVAFGMLWFLVPGWSDGGEEQASGS